MSTIERMRPSPVREGDEVLLFDRNRRGRDGVPATVAKAGRHLVDIKDQHGRIQKFRMDTGQINDNYGHQYYLTLADAERGEREDAARDLLQGCGIEFGFRADFTTEQIEQLADLVRTFAPKVATS